MTKDITASELQAGMTIDECEAEPGLVGWKAKEAKPCKIVEGTYEWTPAGDDRVVQQDEWAEGMALDLERETGFKLPAMTVYYDKPMHLPAKPAESVTETRTAYLRTTDKVRVTE